MTREERIKRTWRRCVSLADVLRERGYAQAELYDPPDLKRMRDVKITDTVECVTFVGESQVWFAGGQTSRWYRVTFEGLYVGKVYY